MNRTKYIKLISHQTWKVANLNLFFFFFFLVLYVEVMGVITIKFTSYLPYSVLLYTYIRINVHKVVSLVVLSQEAVVENP